MSPIIERREYQFVPSLSLDIQYKSTRLTLTLQRPPRAKNAEARTYVTDNRVRVKPIQFKTNIRRDDSTPT